MSIRVLVVDDQPLVRAGFRMVLDAQPDIEVVGEASDGAQALRVVDQLRAAGTPADIVVMDIRMPVMDGVAATRELCQREFGRPRVIVLTTFDTDAEAFASLQAGASGFLLKNVPPEELLAAIRVVAGGDAVVAPRVTRRLLDRFAGQFVPQRTDARLTDLTEREREVFLLVAQGLSNAEIAQRLHITEATVKAHVGKILTKQGLRDRVQIVVMAYETGLLRPGA
jgi:DNA-binding NarL/FixJ family response regulator